ncbi:hypothetical protein RJ639_023141 [Escallonia herrerae]|uniref:arginine--tRNA ligase n=1 Tax=Escallonia herrerae TaxID=1293975 RepID=A0AA88V163_9ASTE|nr:hypothetical protein RJ639_023141 [Escallonia herrerae]
MEDYYELHDRYLRLGLLGLGENWTNKELEQTAEALGFGAVKYASLENNLLTDYLSDCDRLFIDEDNPAVDLLSEHARICSIIKKSGKDIEELKKTGKLELNHPAECRLGLHLLQFAEIVEDACTKLSPSVLCEYLDKISYDFFIFDLCCQVVGSAEEISRLLLCEATAIVMGKCLHLLGLTPIKRNLRLIPPPSMTRKGF